MIARALGLFFGLGLALAAQAEEGRYYYLRPGDYQCLVSKANIYARSQGAGPVLIVFRDCPTYPKQQARRGQYPAPPARGRRDDKVVYADEVIALSKGQLSCLAKGKIGRASDLVDRQTGFVKLSTSFGC